MSDQDKKQVSFTYFAARPHLFPWEALGMDRPKVGKPHSYACTIAAQHSRIPVEMIFLQQRPTLRELERFVTKFDPMDDKFPEKAKEIYNLFGNKDNATRFEAVLSSPVEIQVIYYMQYCNYYRKWAKDHLTSLWKQGIISVPEEAIFNDW